MRTAPPALEGVEHRYVATRSGLTIHVADAGPADGDAVLLVHGFPQNWFEWRRLIGPLAADGHRVLCPDLRGAGWSDAPADRYAKTDMADDLLDVLDALGVDRVALVGHDWGGLVGFLLMLRHPERVTRFLGLNTAHPWLRLDAALVLRLWRFWYQLVILLPVVGPRVIADPRRRFLRRVCRWAGAGYYWTPAEEDVYLGRFGDRARAVAASRWYRTFQTREFLPWARGAYGDVRVTVPVLFLHGDGDPAVTPTLLRGYESHADDMRIEYVDGPGHWLPEQAPELVLSRARPFLRG